MQRLVNPQRTASPYEVTEVDDSHQAEKTVEVHKQIVGCRVRIVFEELLRRPDSPDAPAYKEVAVPMDHVESLRPSSLHSHHERRQEKALQRIVPIDIDPRNSR